MSTVTNDQAVKWCTDARTLLKKLAKPSSSGKRDYTDLKSASENAKKYIDLLRTLKLDAAAKELEAALQKVGELLKANEKKSEEDRAKAIEKPVATMQALTKTASDVVVKHGGYVLNLEAAQKNKRELQAQGAEVPKIMSTV